MSRESTTVIITFEEDVTLTFDLYGLDALRNAQEAKRRLMAGEFTVEITRTKTEVVDP